jgi:thiol-disulfide isomerase/thioredoxin
MRFITGSMVVAFALAGCGSSGTTNTGADAGATADVVTVTDVVTAPTDAGAAPTDAGGMTMATYPAGPYGARIGALFEPFGLTACNRQGAEANWRFDQPDFFSSAVTVVTVSAGWCVPCQMEARQIEAEIVRRYEGMGVRIVMVLVQDANYRAITESFCNTWVNRYSLTMPVLMDPTNVMGIYYPRGAFPANIVIDRRGRIRAQEYGSETGLSRIRGHIEDVLANPNG